MTGIKTTWTPRGSFLARALVAGLVALVNAAAAVAYLTPDPHRWSLGAQRSMGLSFAADASVLLLALSLLPKRRWASLAAAFALAALLVTTHLLCGGYYRIFQSLPTGSALAFLHQYPAYTWALITERLRPLAIAGALLATSALAWIFHYTGPTLPGGRRLQVALPLAVLGVALGTRASAPDLTLDHYALSVITKSPQRKLPAGGWKPNRIPLPALARAERPNLLLFRLEEINRDAVGLYHPGLPTTPFASALERDHPEEMFVAQSQVANATATDVAVPLLYTGAPPDAPASLLQRLPMIWDYFNAAGYDTSLDVPYSLRWGHFDTLFCDRPGELTVHHLFHAGQPGRRLVYDASVNDSDIYDDVLAYQTARNWAGPFFQIVSLKMPHADGDGARINGYHPLPNLAAEPWRQHYYDAIAYDDSLMQRLVESMPPEVRAHTIIAAISDHGADVRKRRVRLENYYQEATAVPFWIDVPLEVQRGLPAGALDTLRAQFQAQVTSHLDVLPTLLDLTGLYREPELQTAVRELPGRSLLQPGAPAEPLVILSTGALRSWDREGFALLFAGERTRYLFDLGREHLFDETTDPNDDRDLLGDPAYAPLLERARRFAAADPALARIVQRYNGANPRRNALAPKLSGRTGLLR